MKYTYQLKPSRKKHWWVWLSAAAIIIAVGIAAWLLTRSEAEAHAPKPSTAVVKVVTKPTEGLSTNLLFVGDVFWGRSMQTKAEASPQKYDYLAKGLSRADRANYDAWIANFECPITTKDIPYQLQLKYLDFNCRPEYLANLAKWFTAVSQANNHADNNGGKWGLDQTRANLQKAGIQNFGTYDMNDTSDICEVIAVPAHTTAGEKVKMPLAMCGFMYVVDTAPTDAQLAVMKAYAKVMPVVAFPHMGVEYRTTAEDAKVSAYHRMIDNGADVVIGAHPHVIQNSENYHGRLIAYSTGNFLFDQQTLGRHETLGLGVKLKLTIKDPAAAALYEEAAKNCQIYKDNCLAALRAKMTKRPAIGVSYGFTCYDEASGTPRLGDAAACRQAKAWATVDKLGALDATW
jgi:hypothetical protein